jgi:hypothetical protein
VVLLLPARGAGAARRPAGAHDAVGVLEGHGVTVVGVLVVGEPGDRGEADHGVLPWPRAHGHQDQVEDERVQGRRRGSAGGPRGAGSSQSQGMDM